MSPEFSVRPLPALTDMERSWTTLTVWCIFCLLGSALVGGILAAQVPGHVWWWALLLVPLCLPLVIVVHESIHALVLRGLGYGVEIAVVACFPPAAYVSMYGQVLVPWHIMLGTLAPLIVVTGSALAVIMSGLHWLASLSALIVLGINLLGSVHDLCVVQQLAQLPRGSLLYGGAADAPPLVIQPNP